MVSLEELGIVIPLIMSIFIPFAILGASRFLKGSDTLTKSSLIAEQRLKNMEEDIEKQHTGYKEIYQRLSDLEKAVYNICWRIEKVEKDHEHSRLE